MAAIAHCEKHSWYYWKSEDPIISGRCPYCEMLKHNQSNPAEIIA